ncbi:MAG: dienelactone hydrolase family protein [Actinobacteria bacterium]|nr:dienelactone hydrolase family protein [Actinomycetota bacterium]
MSVEQLSIRTADGQCPAYVCTPDAAGSAPAVIFYMDGLGMRPTIVTMAQRLANLGYVVLAPDLFYRAGPYDPLNPREVFASGNPMAIIGELFSSTDTAKAAADTAAFLAYLDSRDDVTGTRIGTTGYCMGGGISLTVAGVYPDRVAAAASFHGGNLVIDSELSPHRHADRITGRVYVAGADHDRGYPPEMAAELEQILTAADVPHRCEIYPDALHGFTMTDFPVYDEAAAERHWRELESLLAASLPR